MNKIWFWFWFNCFIRNLENLIKFFHFMVKKVLVIFVWFGVKVPKIKSTSPKFKIGTKFHKLGILSSLIDNLINAIKFVFIFLAFNFSLDKREVLKHLILLINCFEFCCFLAGLQNNWFLICCVGGYKTQLKLSKTFFFDEFFGCSRVFKQKSSWMLHEPRHQTLGHN